MLVQVFFVSASSSPPSPSLHQIILSTRKLHFIYIVFVMDKQCFGWVCLSIIGICGIFSPNSANEN